MNRVYEVPVLPLRPVRPDDNINNTFFMVKFKIIDSTGTNNHGYVGIFQGRESAYIFWRIRDQAFY